MKRWIIIFLLLVQELCIGQETESIPVSSEEQQLEELAELNEDDPEDDAEAIRLISLRRRKLNLNTAEVEDLREIPGLDEIRISYFLQYRKHLGNLIDVYELQAIPGWGIQLIRGLLPYITIGPAEKVSDQFKQRFFNGEKNWMFRWGSVLEKAKGYMLNDSIKTRTYSGGPGKLLIRYLYNHNNLLQYGFVFDKDAGENLLPKSVKAGPDFTSFHLFVHKMGIVRSLAIGDYTINMGQGLIQWQGAAFSKSSSVLSVKRQSVMIRPHRSPGEYNFHRGVAVLLKHRRWEAGIFGSKRLLDANVNNDTVSSILVSGLHRTESEIQDRHSVKLFTIGGKLSYFIPSGHIGLNAVHYSFSLPLSKKEELYNLFAVKGNDWSNLSMDYSYTFKNFHVFGEIAADKNNSFAQVHGLLASLDQRVDFSAIYRNIPQTYQSFFSKAFTENSLPANEKGLYLGISLRPVIGWRLDFYADHFRFPWLKFRVDSPSGGSEYIVQISFTPSRKVEVYTRLRVEKKALNDSHENSVSKKVSMVMRKNWRTHISFQINKIITLRNRMEIVWFKHAEKETKSGFLCFSEMMYTPLSKLLSGSIRLQYFETDDYDTRLYAYENDLPFSYSVPVNYDSGIRYYLNIRSKLPPALFRRFLNGVKLSMAARWSQTIYSGKNEFGTGPDQVTGNKKSEFKIQLMVNWK